MGRESSGETDLCSLVPAVAKPPFRCWPLNPTEAGGGRGVPFCISISDAKPQEPEMFA